MLKRLKNLFKKKNTELQRKSKDSLHYKRTYQDRLSPFNVIRPDAKKGFAFEPLKIKDLYRMTPAKAIQTFISISDGASLAVSTYKEYTIDDYKIVGDDSAVRIINEFINNMPNGAAGFRNYLLQLAYGSYVEGGICSELVNDNEGMPSKLVYISPWTLEAELRNKEGVGDYYVYGQPDGRGNIDVFVDETDDTKTEIIYIPTHQLGDYPLGSSQIQPALFGMITLSQLVSDIAEFIQGKVYPDLVYSIDPVPLVNAGVSYEEVEKTVNETNEILKGMLDEQEITENIVSPVPIITTMLSSVERSRIDGLEMLIEILDRGVERGLKVPQVIYGSQRQGGGLGSQQERVQFRSFYKRIKSSGRNIETAVNFHFKSIIEAMPVTGEASLVLIHKDEELDRMSAELLKLQAEAYQGWIDTGMFAASELRPIAVRNIDMFADLEDEIPTTEELVEEEDNAE